MANLAYNDFGIQTLPDIFQNGQHITIWTVSEQSEQLFKSRTAFFKLSELAFACLGMRFRLGQRVITTLCVPVPTDETRSSTIAPLPRSALSQKKKWPFISGRRGYFTEY